MKILILVLSYNSPPFDTLMRTQQETFDSVEVEGVRTVYYHGGISDNYPGCQHIPVAINSMQLGFKITDEYYRMAGKFQEALKFTQDWEYDYIFRSNSSSYISKPALVEFAKTLPIEKLYAGWTIVDSEDHGRLAVSGAGIWLSRDTAEILRNEIDENFEMEEDVYCSRILRKNGITAIDDKSRYDVNSDHDYIPLDRYHYRFKGPTGNRLIDAHNMVMLHKKIISEQ